MFLYDNMQLQMARLLLQLVSCKRLGLNASYLVPECLPKRFSTHSTYTEIFVNCMCTVKTRCSFSGRCNS